VALFVIVFAVDLAITCVRVRKPGKNETPNCRSYTVEGIVASKSKKL
jgi:hypothetical protein